MEVELSLKMGIGAVLLLICGMGIAMFQSGSGPAKGIVGNFVNVGVAALFAAAGFLACGVVILFNVDLAGDLNFDPLGLWKSGAEPENLARASWLAAFAAVFTILPLGVAAGRLRWGGVAVFAFLNGAVVLPIIGRWIWMGSVAGLPNQGWLEALNFSDFGGITLISVGVGAAGGAIALTAGARRGKFSEKSRLPFFLPAGNLPLAMIGVIAIAIGWLGFVIGYPGAVSASSTVVGKIWMLFATTAASGIVAAVVYRVCFGALNPLLFLQAIVGGLVAGLAVCSEISPIFALVVGAVAGLLVVFGSLFLERIKIDDVSGIIPAHLFCGFWGILSLAIFGDAAMNSQLIAAAAIILSVGAATFCIAQCLKAFGCFVISKDDENLGLDVIQHGITTSLGKE